MSKIFCTAALLSALALSNAASAQGMSAGPAKSPATMDAPIKSTKTMKPMARPTRPARAGMNAETAEEQATAQLNLRQIGQ